MSAIFQDPTVKSPSIPALGSEENVGKPEEEQEEGRRAAEEVNEVQLYGEEWHTEEDYYCPIPYPPKCDRRCIRQRNICISDYPIVEGEDESFVPPSWASSEEQRHAARHKMTFAGGLDDPNMERCVDFWTRILENNLEPIECAFVQMQKTKTKTKLGAKPKIDHNKAKDGRAAEKVKDGRAADKARYEKAEEAQPCTTEWCFEIWDEIKRLNLDKVKLVRTKCDVCDLPPGFVVADEKTPKESVRKGKPKSAKRNKEAKPKTYTKRKKAKNAEQKQVKPVVPPKPKNKQTPIKTTLRMSASKQPPSEKRTSEVELLYETDRKYNSACSCAISECICMDIEQAPPACCRSEREAEEPGSGQQLVPPPEPEPASEKCPCGADCACHLYREGPVCPCGCKIEECLCQNVDGLVKEEEKPFPIILNAYCAICGRFHCDHSGDPSH